MSGALALGAKLERAGAITPTALILPPDTTLKRWAAMGAMLGEMDSSMTWWIGDWLNFGEQMYGEEHAQAVDSVGLSHETLRQYRRLCEQIPPERRRVGVAMSVHRLVAGLEPAEQTRWLDAAVENGWGRTALAMAMGIKPQGQLPPAEPGSPSTATDPLSEVGLAILRDLREGDDPQFVLVPIEDIARLRAALGVEE